eukprot:gene8967-16102_t
MKAAPMLRGMSLRRAQLQRAEAIPKGLLPLLGDLPIKECIGEVLDTLDNNNCLVLQAPPGAGKTTVVPLALLKHRPDYLLDNGECGTILVLEPRRVAAKSAARRMASMLGERVGQTVGYRVKLDTAIGPKTKIEVITEGILLRRLQRDPELGGVVAVLFDEFHERNLDCDLALALCLDAQAVVRPDLRLVVMSATLGGGLAQAVSQLMGGYGQEGEGEGSEAPVVVSEGRSYPVDIRYLGSPGRGRGELEEAVVEAVIASLKEHSGDVLVFLPGVGEIKRVQAALSREGVESKYGASPLPLHGNLAPDQQDRAIKKGNKGGRRIILSTPIAESSVTIDGVTVVVDSGLRRSPVYDAATGVNRLGTYLISKASADQRAGRAGRTGPGVCVRLWDQRDPMEESTPAEIVDSDLAPLVLQLALCGMAWLDEPDPERLKSAVDLLTDLGAVGKRGKITAEGKRMAMLGVHPRFAHMVLRGADLGGAELAAVLATLLSERDVLRGTGITSADIRLRLR